MPLVPPLAAAGLDVVAFDTISVISQSGSYDHATGRWVSGAPTTTAGVAASVQPARGRDLLRLPENRRNSEAITIYTRTLLSAGDRATGREADRVTYSGRTYEVEHVQTWSNTFVNAVAVLIGE